MSQKTDEAQEILDELHAVSARLHHIAQSVCVEKETVDKIIELVLTKETDLSKLLGLDTTVAKDISDAEERRDNVSGNTDQEDIDNGHGRKATNNT